MPPPPWARRSSTPSLLDCITPSHHHHHHHHAHTITHPFIQKSSKHQQTNSYPLLATALLTTGLCAAAGFFLYEAASSRLTRKASRELALGGTASVCLGLGTLFLLLWTGVYV